MNYPLFATQEDRSFAERIKNLSRGRVLFVRVDYSLQPDLPRFRELSRSTGRSPVLDDRSRRLLDEHAASYQDRILGGFRYGIAERYKTKFRQGLD